MEGDTMLAECVPEASDCPVGDVCSWDAVGELASWIRAGVVSPVAQAPDVEQVGDGHVERPTSFGRQDGIFP